MNWITTVTETIEEIGRLKEDEELRLVVARSGDYGKLWHRDSYSKKEFSKGVEIKGGVYRYQDFAYGDAVANSWEELLVAVARLRRDIGKVSVAYAGRGTVNSFWV